jgi:uncharacterized protein with LGFP repeats
VQDDGTASAVSVSSSQGVQNGSGNVQNNTYGHRARPDPASFSGLSPRTAADRILKLPYDDVVDLFASMAAREASEIIVVLLTADEATVVAILGDLSPRKVADLGGILSGSAKWLTVVPVAAEEISRKAAELAWPGAGGLTRLDAGFYRKYPAGTIIWSKLFGTHAVTGEMEDRFAADDGLGFPAGARVPVPSSPFGTAGTRQDFASGVVYSSAHGTYLVPDSGAHDAEGGSGGWLGFPVAESAAEQAELGSFQRFEGGVIFAHRVGESQVALAVRGDVMGALPSPGQCWPVSKAVAAISPAGSSGHVQRFLLNARADGGRESAVCSSDQVGTYVVAPEIWDYYGSAGNARSWLGYPQGSWQRTGMLSGMQRFEGGTVFWRSDIGTFAVSRYVAVSAVIGDDSGMPGKLGYPVSEEQESASDSGRIQFFERGVIRHRDGKHELWLAPEQVNPGEFFSDI